MSNIDIVKAALKNNMDKRVVHKPNVLAAEAKGTASKQAFEAVTGDLRGIDLDYLDSLNRIQGTLKNTYMESISANKITSGSILGTNLTLAGTEASNNKTTLTMIGDTLLRVNDGVADRIKMSNSGLQFLSAGSFSSAANVGNNSKITSMPGGSDNRIFSSFGFAIAASSFVRGSLLIAHGVGDTGIDGLVRIAATTAHGSNLTDAASAYIDIKSRGGKFGGRGQVSVQADLYAFQQFYALQYAEFRGNTNMKGSLDVDLNTVLRSATTIQGATTLQAALNVSGLTTLGGVDAVNVRVSGQYNNTGVLATFGGGITTTAGISSGGAVAAKGNVLADGGNLVGDGLNVRSGLVAMPANSVDGAMLQAHVSSNAGRAVGANHIRFLAVSADHLGDNAATLRVINSNLFNPDQGSVGLRSISPLLGGTALQTSSGNHSHGSGNSMDFDFLPTAHKESVFGSRAKARDYRARLKDGETLSQAEMMDALYHALYLGATGVMIEIDAPDLTAEERHAKYQRGEEFGEFFEYRRQEQIEDETALLARSAAAGKGSTSAAEKHEHSQRLHARHLRNYARPHPDAA